MHCIECGIPSASLIFLFQLGRLCPKCYIQLVDEQYQPLAYELDDAQRLIEEYVEEEGEYQDG